MKRRLLLLAFLAVWALPRAAFTADDWVAFATISPTTTLTTNRLCYTDGVDLACDRNASISSGGLLTAGTMSTGGLTVSGDTSLNTLTTSGRATLGSFATSGTSYISSTLYMDAARVLNDLYVDGNFYVSGSQIIDGVLFANGGISVTGGVTATYFSGDGSGLTGVTAGSADWYDLTNIPTQVAAVSNTGSISLTNLTVTGTITASTVSASTVSGTYLYGRYVSATQASVGTLLSTLSSNTTTSGTYVYGRYASFTALAGVNASLTGHVSVTGNVSANKYFGDGSGLTGVTAGSADWYDLTSIPAQVQAVSDSGGINLSSLGVTGTVTATTVSGTYLNAQYVSATQASVGTLLSTLSSNTTTSGTYVYGRYASFTALAGVNASLTGHVSVTGNVSANKYFGDGSGLSGVVADSSDRITSGTTLMVANGNTDYISITTGGVTTGYLSPVGVMVINGISVSTGRGISSTNGYFSGNVGIGDVAPDVSLSVAGIIKSSGDLWENGFVARGTGASQQWRFAACDSVGDLNCPASGLVIHQDNVATALAIQEDGDIGIGTTTPSVSLSVIGEVQVSNSGVVCDGTTAGAIRYAGGSLQYCNGTIFTSLGVAGSADWYGLTNIPTQVAAVSDTGSISLTNLTVTGTITASTVSASTVSG
ncbi:MAG: hypothetical protein COY40_07090, partial [Alphaproteobacteria bacterium CG_4_10_14_0_8_um_filter_53_9]